MARKETKAAAAVLGMCAFVVVATLSDVAPWLFSMDASAHHPRAMRRSLQAEEEFDGQDQDQQHLTIPLWARNHLRPLETVPDPTRETVLFWHIPKSGGTTVKSIYECLGQTLAHQAGADPRYGHDAEEGIVAFQPWPGVSRASYVNADTTNRRGIMEATRRGLVQSGLADVIISSDPAFAVDNLYDEAHKGRVVALFRHPIDRLVSKFYYLQTATWERDYRPQWGHIEILDFAKTRNVDNNQMVKKLAGIPLDGTANEDDLRLAMRTVRKRFVVGLMHEMEESVRRFNVVLGVDEDVPENRECMDHFFHKSLGARKHNSHEHPHVARGTPAWNALASKNALDIRLYEFVLKLFDEQKELIQFYADSFAESNVVSIA